MLIKMKPPYHIQYSEYATGLTVRCSNPAISPPTRPDGLWGPPGLLLNAYRDSFAGIWRQGVMLTIHLHLPPGSGESGTRPLHLLYAFTPWAALSLALIKILYCSSCVLNKYVFISFRSTLPLHSTPLHSTPLGVHTETNLRTPPTFGSRVGF